MSVLILVFASAFVAAMFISLAGINIEIAFGTVATAAIWVFAAAAITRGRRGSATGIAASTVTIVGAAAALAGFTGEFAAADAIRRIFTGDRKSRRCCQSAFRPRQARSQRPSLPRPEAQPVQSVFSI